MSLEHLWLCLATLALVSRCRCRSGHGCYDAPQSGRAAATGTDAAAFIRRLRSGAPTRAAAAAQAARAVHQFCSGSITVSGARGVSRLSIIGACVPFRYRSRPCRRNSVRMSCLDRLVSKIIPRSCSSRLTGTRKLGKPHRLICWWLGGRSGGSSASSSGALVAMVRCGATAVLCASSDDVTDGSGEGTIGCIGLWGLAWPPLGEAPSPPLCGSIQRPGSDLQAAAP